MNTIGLNEFRSTVNSYTETLDSLSKISKSTLNLTSIPKLTGENSFLCVGDNYVISLLKEVHENFKKKSNAHINELSVLLNEQSNNLISIINSFKENLTVNNNLSNSNEVSSEEVINDDLESAVTVSDTINSLENVTEISPATNSVVENSVSEVVDLPSIEVETKNDELVSSSSEDVNSTNDVFNKDKNLNIAVIPSVSSTSNLLGTVKTEFKNYIKSSSIDKNINSTPLSNADSESVLNAPVLISKVSSSSCKLGVVDNRALANILNNNRENSSGMSK